MSMWRNIFTIIRKELQSYFNNPTAYIVIASFLLLWEFLFFRQVFLIGEVSVRTLFELLPWLSLLVIPALAMGTLAEEKSEGTVEFLLTRPIRPFEIIFGKFVGILAFFSIATAFAFPIAWSFGLFGDMDWGRMLCQYFGGVLLASLLSSLGIAVSSFVASQVAAFIVSAVLSLFLIISGMEIATARLPLFFAPFFEQLSAFNHFQSLSRGVIDLRDLWYFVSFTGVFLGIAFLNVVRIKYGERKKIYQQYRLATFVLLGIAVVSNVVGSRIPGRLDLTEDKLYTLSPATKELLSNLPDDVINVTLYSSDRLPSEFQPVLRDTKDMLSDYRTLAKGKIQVATKNPASSEEMKSEAQSLGVQAVRFNVVSQEEFQIKEGYLGVVVSYGGENEVIPFVQNTRDLEYQLSSFLKKLTTDNKPVIGFVSGHGERALSRDYQRISEEWKKQFEVKEIVAEEVEAASNEKSSKEKDEASPDPKPKKLTIPDDVKVLVVAGPDQNYSEEEKKTISDFLAKGGSALFLVDGVSVSPSIMTASKNASDFADFLKNETGITVGKDMLYDLRANESVSFGGGQMQYILPYPLWVRAQKIEGTSPITTSIREMSLPWPSSIEGDDSAISEKGYEKVDLFSTTQFSGKKDADFSIEPDQKFSQTDLARRTVAVSLTPKEGKSARMVIVGDSDFLTDQFVGNNQANLSFGLEAVAWLGQESSLGSIAAKNASERKFSFTTASEPNMIKFGNIAFAVLVPSVYGMWHLYRRNRKKRFSYEEEM